MTSGKHGPAAYELDDYYWDDIVEVEMKVSVVRFIFQKKKQKVWFDSNKYKCVWFLLDF